MLTAQQGYFVPGVLFKLTSKTCHTLTILIFLVLPKWYLATILLSYSNITLPGAHIDDHYVKK